MDESNKNSPCKECKDGAGEVQLLAEVDHLRQHLSERDSHILNVEAEFLKCSKRNNDLEEQVDTWREKYERLYDSHKRVQKLNQVLEDKLLQLVDKMKSEKSQLTKDIATLSVRLAESKHNYSMLQKENERYKNDMNLAIQLLQCKPDNFVSQKLDNLPIDTQARVSQYVMSKTPRPSTSSNQSKNGNDITETFDASEYEFNISASLMSKILEDSIQDTLTKHCDTCSCTKTQNKPFCYNETFYSVSTQTAMSGDMKNSHCLNCNAEIKSLNSNISIQSGSPHAVRLINDKTPNIGLTGPLYLVPQPSNNAHVDKLEDFIEKGFNLPKMQNTINSQIDHPKIDVVPPNIVALNKIDVKDNASLVHANPHIQKDIMNNIAEEINPYHKNTVHIEPAVHHKLCDRTKTPISGMKNGAPSIANEDLLIKDTKKEDDGKEVKPKNEVFPGNVVRKNSIGSMGSVSRTSSAAKSTVSTHKSNTQVGPGPRFCHLRMQAGSKNILLDNAEPDVPPVLYRRQSKCNDNTIFKELHDSLENFIDLNKDNDNSKNNNIANSIVVESTLIDVHTDTAKDSNVSLKPVAMNPVLLNVSSSPLQPLKTHNFSTNSSENINDNNQDNTAKEQTTSEIDNLLEAFNVGSNTQNDNDVESNKVQNSTPTDSHNLKIFNFDRYEQSKQNNHYNRPLRKIDMAQLHSLENTKISKDFPPLGTFPKLEIKPDIVNKSVLPAIVNVYPNLTQTHLKVNENKKVFTNEQSTSSLSSDDSAALLQKQQLLRVAEWVEKNLEQQNNLNDPLVDDVAFATRALRRDSKINRLSETLNDLALNMPHPVSKYSKSFPRDNHMNWLGGPVPAQNNNQERNGTNSAANLKQTNTVKETIFPVEGDGTITEVSKEVSNVVNARDFDFGKRLREIQAANGERVISAEELARMEYNVKQFLLSGPHWVNPGLVSRSRRTSSKTETDV